MKWTYLSIVALLCAAVLASCDSQKTEPAPADDTKASIAIMRPEAAQDLLSSDKNVIVLDVRSAGEYAAGHIDGAINIDVNDPRFNEKVNELDKTKTYVVHCGRNVEQGRSAYSMEVMTKSGFRNLISMEGGIEAWEQEGHPMSRGAEN